MPRQANLPCCVEAPEWFGDHFAAYRCDEVEITGVGTAGRATVREMTVNTTALVDMNVVPK